MHRWLIGVLRVMDVRLLYIFASVFVIPPTLVFNSPARKAMYSYFRRRHHMGRMKAAWMTYVNHCKFAQVVIDRFAMYAGKKFKISIDGYNNFTRLASRPEGFIQLSSHIGNYELAGYSLRAEKRFNAMVFGGEKGSVMANRNRMFEENNIRMIPVAPDMSHLFLTDRALSDGEIISMPADRVFGSPKSFALPFLGATAQFPQGPFQLAALRDAPLLFVTVMKTSLMKYHITVHRLSTPAGGNSRQRAEAMAREFVGLLEETVKRHPDQWYNYFDFWTD